jgi:NAD(P)H-flavin reductase
MKINRSRLALFSGPHGISTPVCAYESVIMIATGFGIAAQLPYVKQLILGYNNCKARTRRVHLVWQLQSIGNIDSILA